MELTTEQQTVAFLWAFLLGAIIEIIYTADRGKGAALCYRG